MTKTKVKKSIASLLTLIAVSPAFAAKENVVITKRPIGVLEDSSEANRINKNAMVTLSLTGFGPNMAPATTLTGGIFLDRNKLLLIEGKNGNSAVSRSYTESYNGVVINEGSADAKISQIGGHYKQFVSNSFYFKTGLDYSRVDFKYDFKISSTNRTTSFDGDALIASFTIGNQWQWQNFTLGADWIGLSSPLASRINNQSISSSASETDKKEFEDDKKMYLTGGSFTALRFYIGASF
jgi:hypothetical protein